MARLHVLISDELLRAIDEVVGQRGRSRFLEQAAQEKLDRLTLSAAIDGTAGVLADIDYPRWRDRQAIARHIRRVRRGSRTR
jgi:metal-responsive CopG/Arc/MetJ family transcriptional regulator